MEVGLFGPRKEPDQISAFNMEDVYSSEAKINNASPMYFMCSRKSQRTNVMATAMHVNDMEVSILGPLNKPDQTSAFNMENIYSSEAKSDDTSSMTAVHVDDMKVCISGSLKESDQISAFDMEDFDSFKASREVVIANNKRMQAKNEKIRLAKQERSDNTTLSVPDPRSWISRW
jgi:hypothetical protein